MFALLSSNRLLTEPRFSGRTYGFHRCAQASVVSSAAGR